MVIPLWSCFCQNHNQVMLGCLTWMSISKMLGTIKMRISFFLYWYFYLLWNKWKSVYQWHLEHSTDYWLYFAKRETTLSENQNKKQNKKVFKTILFKWYILIYNSKFSVIKRLTSSSAFWRWASCMFDYGMLSIPC